MLLRAAPFRGLPAFDSNRQRPRVHLSGVHGLAGSECIAFLGFAFRPVTYLRTELRGHVGSLMACAGIWHSRVPSPRAQFPGCGALLVKWNSPFPGAKTRSSLYLRFRWVPKRQCVASPEAHTCASCPVVRRSKRHQLWLLSLHSQHLALLMACRR